VRSFRHLNADGIHDGFPRDRLVGSVKPVLADGTFVVAAIVVEE
jgi:hypothetical protein